MQQLDDNNKLVDALRQGDQNALVGIINKYHGKIYRVATFYLKSPEKAQEITQDIFLKIWFQREKLSGITDFAAYLFIVARNEIIDTLRKKRVVFMKAEDIYHDTGDPETILILKEMSATLREGIQQLPPVRRKVFIMSRYEGLSYKEIATNLNISTNGVKDHIVKATRFLRKYMGKEEGDILLLLVLLQHL